MDFAALNLNARGNEGAWVEMSGPAGQVIGLEIKVAGAKSDRVVKAVEAAERRYRDAMEAKRTKQEDFERLNKQRDEEITLAATLDWRIKDGEGHKSTLTFEGEELGCTPENVRRLLLHPGFDWLAAQVIAAARDAAVFTKP
ncbi:MAG TPA: hypothetical protein VNV16_11555 [Methylibium sp.]|nr:hypothetical protein [Methylibium sp.]